VRWRLTPGLRARDELDRVGDDLGGVVLIVLSALLILPLAGLEAALDVDQAAFLEVVGAVLCGATKDDALMVNSVKLRVLRGPSSQGAYRLSPP
jgi:hypothetical protein